MNKIKNLESPDNIRIIVISDIHGELELFKDLLEKVHYSHEDYLIINGDLCEKGSNSLGVVRYIMDLSATHSNIHVTEGNCDTLVEDLLEENPKLLNYLTARKHSIINEWLGQIGFALNEATTIQEIKERLIHHFSKEMKWLTELPTAIETEDYIFVHAGLEEKEDWKDTDRITAITLQSFLDKSHLADKYVIVGHWPVVNYSSDISSHNPIIDEGKKIIAIDGGNIIKKTGQLNAFIINRTTDGDVFSYTYTDKFPLYAVMQDFQAEPVMTGSISYPAYELQPLQKDEHFTICKQEGTNEKLLVKNEYIHQDEDGNFTAKSDVSCALISVEKGDIVSLMDDTCSGFDLVKKDGMSGWVPKGILQKFNKSEKNEQKIDNQVKCC
ncbi:metallophosphoesterase [Bacillus sp. Marseille-Q1617]|uniref:metallophosphoesterase n=1 Tax=Bacillus sp. Marseille-Q1617 TaxID=2736887 RepID=UPI00158B4CA7|nr:metallophosphoesterase [Bacillus sp. Marseille-Q1617]